VIEGGQQLVAAGRPARGGQLRAAIPELRQASQSFRVAIDEARHELAAQRARVRSRQSQPAASRAREPELPPVSGNARADVKLVTIPGGRIRVRVATASPVARVRRRRPKASAPTCRRSRSTAPRCA
jgi:hypothetical protein